MSYFVKTPPIIRKTYPKAIWNIPTESRIVYLTFDDGPIPEVTPWVLEQLRNFNAEATFFCVGKNVDANPSIYQHIIDEGHQPGNHTYNHINGWKTKDKEYIDNIEKCRGKVNSKLFRPPYGRMTPSQYSLISDNFSIIMWDVLSGDFDVNLPKEKCLGNILKNSKRGSIIVLHDSVKAREKLFYVLPKVLEHFSEKGYSFNAVKDVSDA